MTPEQHLIERAYAAFNARDIDTAVALMQPDIDWPNGWEGGYVHGIDAVRDYWTRQWAVINPSVEPVRFSTDADERIVVDVHQIVRDLAGAVLADQMVQHIYLLEHEHIKRMEIRKP